MAKRIERTDPHRPGAIIPADYQSVLWYSLPSMSDGMPMPSYRVNCEIDCRVETRDPLTHALISVANGEHDASGHCCVIGLLHVARVTFAAYGGTGKCSVCGAHFVEGEIWQHIPSGEHVHLGHTCADKYEMYADWSAEELARERQRDNARTMVLRGEKALARSAFLDDHPGLVEALKTDHAIVRDIAARFVDAAVISDKQIALVMKLTHEAANPSAVEVRTEAPMGKTTFRGRVVSVKSQESDYGTTMRMTVKVTTGAGVWLAWGTAPSALFDATCNHEGGLRGAGGGPGTEVEITATLERGRDRGFAIMKRPRGKVVSLACGDNCGDAACRERRNNADAHA